MYGIKINFVSEYNIDFDFLSSDKYINNIANQLRRIILSEIPILAIDKIIIHNNTSYICDELLINRLCLTPLYYTSVNELLDKCNCDNNCELCSIKLKLNITCNEQIKNIFVGNIESLNPNLYIIYDDIILTPIVKNQTINLTAFAKKGTASKHIKWSPISDLTYIPSNNFVNFKIETNGSITSNELLSIAIEIFNKKFPNFSLSIQN